MKTIFKTGILSIIFIFLNSFSASAIDIDLHVTSDDGCEWHITGTADIDFGWSGVTVGNYDVTASGPCGTFHFTGATAPNDNNEETITTWRLNVRPISPTSGTMSTNTRNEIHKAIIKYYRENN